MTQKVISYAFAAVLIFATSAKSVEHNWLDVPIEEVPDAALQDAIGVASIWCHHEGMVCSGCTLDELARDAEAQRREKAVNRYEKKGGTFNRIVPFAVEQFVPLSHLAHEGVLRRFPATKTQGDFVEIIYDAKRNLRGWVRLTGETYGQCEVSFQSLVKDGPIEIVVDFNSLLRGQSPRLYKSPSRAAPSVELTYGYIDSEFKDRGVVSLTELRNGFGLLTVEDCEGKRSKSLGWLPLRDEQGRLTVWVCDWCGCGC